MGAAITMKVYLLVVHGQPEGKSLLFPRGQYLFGRGDECHIRPNSDWVSRQHCLLRVTSDKVLLRDLGSRNGTLVNGERLVGERPLLHGDMLQVGPLVFQVHLEEPVESDVTKVSRKSKQEETLTAFSETKEVVSFQHGNAPSTLPMEETAAEAELALPPAS